MSDGWDVYLSRSLKNWASRHAPPAATRQRLLRAAAAPFVSPKQSWYVIFLDEWRNRFAYQPEAHDPSVQWLRDPISHFSSWYHHASVTLRLAS